MYTACGVLINKNHVAAAVFCLVYVNELLG